MALIGSEDEIELLRQSVANAVRGLRARQKPKISQETLAELSGIDRTYVATIERGTHNLTLPTLWRLAHGLGVSPAYLTAEIDRNFKRRVPAP